MSASTAAPGPRLLDGLSLLAQTADDLVLATVRDTHDAIAGRIYGTARLGVGKAVAPPQLLHRAIADSVFGGIGLALRGSSKGLDKLAAAGIGPGLEDDPRGRLLTAAVNGLIGDELLRERPEMAIPMAVRLDGRDVDVYDDASLRSAYPKATRKIAVFLHGLCEDEQCWNLHRDRTGTTYPEALETQGWTPVLLRANTGLPIRQNGVALAALLQQVVDRWPTDVDRIALVGHSMGALIMRASSAVMSEGNAPAAWTGLVSDVVTLGAPHRGSWFAVSAGHGSRVLGWLEETAAFGRIIDRQSEGILDLVEGLAEDVPPIGHANYRLVSATITRTGWNPVGGVFGDGLVAPLAASGRDRRGRELFPDATVLRVGRTDHFGLLNHPRVLAGLKEWLA
jgi:pimeloyl-ACP methyl ester carboxylesterase